MQLLSNGDSGKSASMNGDAGLDHNVNSEAGDVDADSDGDDSGAEYEYSGDDEESLVSMTMTITIVGKKKMRVSNRHQMIKDTGQAISYLILLLLGFGFWSSCLWYLELLGDTFGSHTRMFNKN
jgi:Na+-transporting NADH:ubiquinone oxidoreductase subunit NqrC